MKWAHLWVVHFSGLLKCRLSGGIVFDVLQRMMASFIAGQQRNNIPHVDRTPYSPQRSRGSARPFLPELSSRSSSPLARQLSPSCFVRPQPDALNYIWILSPSPSLSPHSAVACYFASLSESCPGITVTKSPTEKSNKTSRRRSHDAANSLRDSSPCSRTNHCISQMLPTAKSNRNQPSSPSLWNLTHPTKMKNEQYYHFTDSCQKDINRIQLQRRLETDPVVCGSQEAGSVQQASSNAVLWGGTYSSGREKRHSQYGHWSGIIIQGDIQWIRDRKNKKRN